MVYLDGVKRDRGMAGTREVASVVFCRDPADEDVVHTLVISASCVSVAKRSEFETETAAL